MSDTTALSTTGAICKEILAFFQLRQVQAGGELNTGMLRSLFSDNGDENANFDEALKLLRESELLQFADQQSHRLQLTPAGAAVIATPANQRNYPDNWQLPEHAATASDAQSKSDSATAKPAPQTSGDHTARLRNELEEGFSLAPNKPAAAQMAQTETPDAADAIATPAAEESTAPAEEEISFDFAEVEQKTENADPQENADDTSPAEPSSDPDIDALLAETARELGKPLDARPTPDNAAATTATAQPSSVSTDALLAQTSAIELAAEDITPEMLDTLLLQLFELRNLGIGDRMDYAALNNDWAMMQLDPNLLEQTIERLCSARDLFEEMDQEERVLELTARGLQRLQEPATPENGMDRFNARLCLQALRPG